MLSVIVLNQLTNRALLTSIDIMIWECSDSVLCGGREVAGFAKLEGKVHCPLPVDADHREGWLQLRHVH